MMTIEDAIEKLDSLRKRYGPNVQIFFDCPECGKSFTPGIVIAQAIHWKSDKEKK